MGPQPLFNDLICSRELDIVAALSHRSGDVEIRNQTAVQQFSLPL
jgi:hypothetical protein